MSKSTRQRKLKLLKAIAAQNQLAQKLVQERHINTIQTKLMENELANMKAHLEQLELQRLTLLDNKDHLESLAAEGYDDKLQGCADETEHNNDARKVCDHSASANPSEQA